MTASESTADTVQSPETPPIHDVRDARRAGVSAFVGTTIEWFDFYIYGTASALVLGRLFFPETSAAVGTLAAFATFAIGFVARPLGGIIFGHFGDKFGRKKVVVTTLMLMGVGTVGVGLLPTYAQIGVWAPILLVCLRILQGIAMGGEWGGAVLIATEFAPENKKVLYGAFAQQGSPVGNLLATVAFLCLSALSNSVFDSWGWRIPFLASAGLIVVALYIRVKITETPEMQEAVANQEKKRVPLVEVLRSHLSTVVLGIGAVVAGVAITYIKTTFALSWATSDLSFSRSEFLMVITLSLLVQAVVQPFGAVLATRIEPRRAVLIMLLPEIVLLPSMFLLVQTGSLPLAILGMVLATAPHAMYYSALAGILSQHFPTAVRYTGISLAYQISTAVFAGTAPMVSQYLLTVSGSIWPVVGLGVAYVALSLFCIRRLIHPRRTRSASQTVPDSETLALA